MNSSAQLRAKKTFVLKAVDAGAAVNLAVFPVLSDHFPVTEEMPCKEKECVFVQYVHLPPAVYLPWMWAIAAHYGDNYLSYNLSYYCKSRPRPVRTYIMERRKHGERKVHLSQMQECVCLRETTLCIIFPVIITVRFVISQLLRCCFLSSDGANGVHDKKEVVGGEHFLGALI